MKKFLFVAVSALLLCGPSMAVERMVFVDMEQVFNGFYRTKLAKAKIKTQQEGVAEERLALVNEMTNISADVDTLRKEARDVTQSLDLRDSKRLLYEERLYDLRDKEKEIVEFDELRTQQYQMQVQRMSQTIMDEIGQTIVEYAQQEGLAAVIDSSTRGSAYGVFIYTHPDVDITETILMVLNSKQPDLNNEDIGEVVQESEGSGEASENNETE